MGFAEENGIFQSFLKVEPCKNTPGETSCSHKMNSSIECIHCGKFPLSALVAATRTEGV